jgi:hypothetical protein
VRPGKMLMKKPLPFAFAAAAIFAAVGGATAFLVANAPERRAAEPIRPAWVEVAWPFPIDPWGRGRAFRCTAADCGSEVNLFLRAKIGFCNCVSAIDDDEVDRVGDVDLAGGERSALGPGRPIGVRWMDGRSRGYTIGGRGAGAKSALAIAFHDHCDVIVATAAVGSAEPVAQEGAVLAFLNSDLVLHWAEVTLGL